MLIVTDINQCLIVRIKELNHDKIKVSVQFSPKRKQITTSKNEIAICLLLY